MRYYNKANQPGHELFHESMSSPRADLIYEPAYPDHIELIESNVFWSTLAPNTELTYDGNGVPNGTQPIGISVEDQATLALQAAGVNARSVLHAQYMNDRGDSSHLIAIDAAVDAVVISSGLTLSQVSGLM